MKNSKSFQKELDSLDITPTSALQELRRDLRSLAQVQDRSDQHQAWAWTRLREELKKEEPSFFSLWKMRLLPVTGLAVLFLVAGVLFYTSKSDLNIDSTGPELFANTFKSNGADVVWVTGYHYIPSSYPLK